MARPADLRRGGGSRSGRRRTLIGTVVNAAGPDAGQVVPLDRVAVFAEHGLGTSPTYVFAIDQSGIVVSDQIGVRSGTTATARRPGGDVARLGDGLA